MKEYIDREAACAYRPPEKCERRYSTYNLDDAFDDGYDEHIKQVEAIPAADVVEVRQIRAFIDRLVAERDKYDLHSMRWEHYDCDRLLIEQMLDEMDGGLNDE